MMLNMGEFVEFLKEAFPEGAVVSGGKEFLCRCRICGDSSTNVNKMRFYISLAHPSGLIWYHCFNCDAGGLLTPNILRQLCDAPPDILLQLSSLNKGNKSGIAYLKRNKFNMLKKEVIDESYKKYEYKRKYFNDRIGLNFSFQDMIDNNFVVSIINFLNLNQLQYTRHPNIIQEFDDYFLGVVTTGRSRINLRNLNQGGVYHTIDKKYVNYRLFDTDTIDTDYFSLPGRADYSKRIRINVAEGFFDICSIAFNLRTGGSYANELYTSVGNKSYSSVVKMYLIKYGLLNPVFHFYVDNDVEDYYLDKIRDILEPIYIESYIHKNGYKNEKDFGVPISRIKDNCFKLTGGW